MIEERILLPILKYYLTVPQEFVDKQALSKERIGTVDDLQIIIYSNDHDPPHFHVKSRDKKINAKFKIENCDLISGEISSKKLKRIRAFYSDIKTQIVMEKVWNKKKS